MAFKLRNGNEPLFKKLISAHKKVYSKVFDIDKKIRSYKKKLIQKGGDVIWGRDNPLRK